MTNVQRYDIGPEIIYKLKFDFGNTVKFWNWYYNKAELSRKPHHVSNNPGFLSDLEHPIDDDFWLIYINWLKLQIQQLYNTTSTVYKVWIKEDYKHSYVDLHDHPNVDLVTVGYAKTEHRCPSSNLVFQNVYNGNLEEIPVNKGDVLVFNGSARHSTKPKTTQPLRVVVGASFNVTNRHEYINKIQKSPV